MSKADADQSNKPDADAKQPEVLDGIASAPQKPLRQSRLKRWSLPFLVLGIAVVLAFQVWGSLRDQVWSYFTDDQGTRVEVEEDKARYVLWQDPKQNVFVEKRDPKAPAAIDPTNRPSGRFEAAFSPDGTMMVIVRSGGDKLDTEKNAQTEDGAPSSTNADASDHADMYLSRWNGRVWTRPVVIDQINTPANERGPVFSRDGKYLFFSSDREGGKGGDDLYVARWNGVQWTGVEPLGDTVNTEASEYGPGVSADGMYLYFSSVRDGSGKEDILVAKRKLESDETEAAQNSKDSNSIVNDGSESGDAVASDGEKGKAGKRNKNNKRKGNKSLPEIAAKVTVFEPHALPPVPIYEQAQLVDHLNSGADDLQPALTARGDHVFLASDRDRQETEEGEKGFAVYFSRVVEGKVMAPEKVDLYIDEGNATDPAVRMDGFDLLFSTDIDIDASQPGMSGADRIPGDSSTPNAAEQFRLYRSTTREVIGWTDLSRWEQFKELINNIMWWILLAIAALVALIYLLEHWGDITSLFHKCLAGSLAVHLLFLFIAMLLLIAQELDSGGEEQAPPIAISIDALAEEELALESEPEIAEMADSKVALLTEKIQSDFKIPVFKPLQTTKKPPIIASTSKQSLVQDVRASKANETPEQQPKPKPTVTSELLKSLPDIKLPDVDIPKLEEANAAEEQLAEKPADPTSDLFKPTKSIPQVATKQAQEKAEKTSALKDAAEATEVEQGAQAVETKDTGGDLVLAHRGLESDGSPPKLDGIGTKASTLLNLGGPDSRSDPLLPGKLETPNADLDNKALTKMIRKQRGKPSPDIIKALGGTDASERAIGEAIEWLTKNQEADGHWDVRKHGAKGNYDTAGAGLALLCYYGWGIKHNAPGKYQAAVTKGLDWLIKQQKENGDLRGGGRMYCHGIAAIALCEAYGVTKDPKLKEPAQKAIDLIVASQSKTKGGWRYEPRSSNDSDTSVTGWQVMALHSAIMADLEVPDVVLEKARLWFDAVGGGKHGGLYGYTGPGKSSPAMVATGMFCRQLDLFPPTDPKMIESAEFLKLKPMKTKNPDFYYVYYATLALYQHQGPTWKQWWTKLEENLVLLQGKTGANKGSWDPGSGHGATGGRVVSTSLGVLNLEVLYRLLPMYGFRDADAPPAIKVKGKKTP